ncbi:hypothetical protein HDU79_010746, partial [Rhizoclosmatium sp. JEL0117]
MSAKFRHANIVTFWGTETDPDLGPVLIFERLGKTIFDAVRDDMPAVDLRYKWLHGIAHALKYLHQQDPPIIHRDLKPDNILIRKIITDPKDNRAVLADFGLTTKELPFITTTYSQTGHISFAPPETMIQGYVPSTKYDVYSFGVTMYFIMTGLWPFEGETVHPPQIIVFWVQENKRPHRCGLPNYERKADNMADRDWIMIQKCWSQNEGDRPNSKSIFSEISEWQRMEGVEVFSRLHGDTRVVFKVVETGDKSNTLNQEILKAIDDEDKINAKVRHPNIVNFWGKCCDTQRVAAVLTFEHFRRSIYDFITEEPALLTADKNKWLLDIAFALNYLHEQDPPIVHCHIKPYNVLIDPVDKRAVIADLGSTVTAVASNTAYIKKGPYTGSDFFIPPEATKKEYSLSTAYDVFSFGMTMYFILTRHWPFEEGIRPYQYGQPNYGSKADWVSHKTWDLIQRCWSNNEGERPSSDRILSEILECQIDRSQSTTVNDEEVSMIHKKLGDYYYNSLKVIPNYDQAIRYLIQQCWSNIEGERPNSDRILSEILECQIDKSQSTTINDVEVSMIHKILGDYYYNSLEVIPNYDQAIRWYIIAARNGNSSAEYSLGLCYKNGNGVTQDYTEAFDWFQKAANQENQFAQVELGNCYYYGHGVSCDYDKAFSLFQKAAEKNDAGAQYMLGLCYKTGNGVSLNYNEAKSCFIKAANQNNTFAEIELGNCYYNGHGGEIDHGKAVFWYKRAAVKDNGYAQFELANCYKKGHGVLKEPSKAVTWYHKAAENGIISAFNEVGYCYYHGHVLDKNYDKAFKWYQKAATKDNRYAQLALGNCYKYGHGVFQDSSKAVFWFRKAAEKGVKSAFNELGYFYSNGLGITKDINEAVLWYKKAADEGDEFAI